RERNRRAAEPEYQIADHRVVEHRTRHAIDKDAKYDERYSDTHVTCWRGDAARRRPETRHPDAGERADEGNEPGQAELDGVLEIHVVRRERFETSAHRCLIRRT